MESMSTFEAVQQLSRNVPNLVNELKKMNKLKVLELKLKFHAFVEPTPSWAKDLDKLINE